MTDNADYLIDISELDRADVLIALFKGAKKLEATIYYTNHCANGRVLDKSTANRLIEQTGGWFGYLDGRVLKIDLSKSPLDTRLYDRDNGQGAARKALGHLIDNGRADEAKRHTTDEIS